MIDEGDDESLNDSNEKGLDEVMNAPIENSKHALYADILTFIISG